MIGLSRPVVPHSDGPQLSVRLRGFYFFVLVFLSFKDVAMFSSGDHAGNLLLKQSGGAERSDPRHESCWTTNRVPAEVFILYARILAATAMDCFRIFLQELLHELL